MGWKKWFEPKQLTPEQERSENRSAMCLGAVGVGAFLAVGSPLVASAWAVIGLIGFVRLVRAARKSPGS